jgi:hypothetical protein
MQNPAKIGSQPMFSPLDLAVGSNLGLGGLAGFGPIGALAMAAPIARPVARGAIQTNLYQNTLGVPNYNPLLQPDSLIAALMRGNLAGQQ